jgi:hypothetical protein
MGAVQQISHPRSLPPAERAVQERDNGEKKVRQNQPGSTQKESRPRSVSYWGSAHDTEAATDCAKQHAERIIAHLVVITNDQ